MNHGRLWTLRNKLRVSEGRGVEGWGSLVMRVKEGTYYKKHWVLYATNETSNFTSESGDVLYGD